jgi:hypothetical protein
MALTNLIHSLIERGLGDFLVLHITEDHVLLGNIVFGKEKFVIKDQNLISGMHPEQFRPCWENGFLGCIYDSKDSEWESLSFNGLDMCKLPVDLNATRGNVLRLVNNQHGDRLCDFVGSTYRGFQLMLDNNLLPVVLLKHAHTNTGVSGLVVSDLRMVPMELSVISNLNDIIRKSVEKELSSSVSDSLPFIPSC